MAGEIVGNQSVYWRVRHRDLAGNAKSQRSEPPAADLPQPNTVQVGAECFGHDDIPFADIGKRYERPGYFKLILRFRSQTEAVTELQNAVNAIRSNEATVYVPAINRSNGNVKPADPPAEIEFDW